MTQKFVNQLIRLEASTLPGLTEKAIATFQVYLNPAIGWHLARFFARARMSYPATAIGRDRWLYKAYMMQLHPVTYHDSHVESAFEISQNPGIAAKLKALLIAGLEDPIDAHLKIVAEKTGIPRLTVEAFEILFFNVLDRPNDGAYISTILYPEGRIVEFDEDHFASTPLSDLLLRAAYNYRNIDVVMHLAGLEGAAFVKQLVDFRNSEAESKLESRIMGNALLLAQLGLLNQRSAGLQHAMTLLAAKRSSPTNKVDTAANQKPHDTSAELAAALATPTITDAESKELKAASQPVRSYWHDEDGNVTAFESSESEPNSSEPGDGSSDEICRFPDPIPAMWRNKDFDKPVILVAKMSSPGRPVYYLTSENSGILASEVFFEN